VVSYKGWRECTILKELPSFHYAQNSGLALTVRLRAAAQVPPPTDIRSAQASRQSEGGFAAQLS
jgi:hypothetical protein